MPLFSLDYHVLQCESKTSPPAACGFLTFFHKRFRILSQFFTHLLYVPINYLQL